jgi:hypothetical protein
LKKFAKHLVELAVSTYEPLCATRLFRGSVKL